MIFGWRGNLTREQEEAILASPGTRRLVKDVLELAESKDCVDAFYDVLTATAILKRRMETSLGVSK